MSWKPGRKNRTAATRLLPRTCSLTVRTKSSSMDGRSCTFSRSSLKLPTRLVVASRVACSSYAWRSRRWMAAGLAFLLFRTRCTVRGPLYCFKRAKNEQIPVNTIRLFPTGNYGLSMNKGNWGACAQFRS